MKKNTIIIFVIAIFLFAGGAQFVWSAAQTPYAPTIIAPGDGAFANGSKPVVTGIAQSDMRIAIYIDNIFNGYAHTVSERGGTQSFAYTPFLSLTAGKHTVFARAENVKESVRSTESAWHTFVIEPAYPAPTILKVLRNTTQWQKPTVAGVAPSAATVEIWIDGVLNGATAATADSSGVGNFAYTPFLPLSAGVHTITALATTTAFDGTLKKSNLSQQFTTFLIQPANTVSAIQTAAHTSWEITASTEANTQQQNTTQQNANTSSTETPIESASVSDAPEQTEEIISSSATTEQNQPMVKLTPPTTEEEAPSDILGWVLLILAAVIVAVVLQRRRQNTQTPLQDSSQLQPHAGQQNSHVELVSKEKPPLDKE